MQDRLLQFLPSVTWGFNAWSSVSCSHKILSKSLPLGVVGVCNEGDQFAEDPRQSAGRLWLRRLRNSFWQEDRGQSVHALGPFRTRLDWTLRQREAIFESIAQAKVAYLIWNPPSFIWMSFRRKTPTCCNSRTSIHHESTACINFLLEKGIFSATYLIHQTQGSWNYPFCSSSFEGFPLQWCLVRVGFSPSEADERRIQRRRLKAW